MIHVATSIDAQDGHCPFGLIDAIQDPVGPPRALWIPASSLRSARPTRRGLSITAPVMNSTTAARTDSGGDTPVQPPSSARCSEVQARHERSRCRVGAWVGRLLRGRGLGHGAPPSRGLGVTSVIAGTDSCGSLSGPPIQPLRLPGPVPEHAVRVERCAQRGELVGARVETGLLRSGHRRELGHVGPRSERLEDVLEKRKDR